MRARSRWVAATTRVSTFNGRSAPTGCTVCASSTRSSFACDRERQLAELVEEQRAAARLDERALAIALGAGERALHVAEQVRVDQLLGDRAAIDDDERPRRARRRVVDRPRRELLAGAGLALDQHRRVGRRRHLEHREQLAHRDALARHRAEVIAIARRQHGASAAAIRTGVSPNLTVAPAGTTTSPTRVPCHQVPFVEPRSLIRIPSGGSRARHAGETLADHEHEIAARVRADRDRARTERDRRRLLAQDLKRVRARRRSPSRRGHRQSRLDQRAPIEGHVAQDRGMDVERPSMRWIAIEPCIDVGACGSYSTMGGRSSTRRGGLRSRRPIITVYESNPPACTDIESASFDAAALEALAVDEYQAHRPPVRHSRFYSNHRKQGDCCAARRLSGQGARRARVASRRTRRSARTWLLLRR